MTEQDRKQLDRELCRRWPQKFSADDLAYFARQLEGYTMAEITVALTEFKNSNRFVPKVGEILKLLPQRVDGSLQRYEEPSFAEVLRRQNRQYAGRSDQEVYLRYHRNLWWIHGRRAGNPDAARRQLERSCIAYLITAGASDEEAQRATAFIFEEADMFRVLLAEIRNAGNGDPWSTSGTQHEFA